MISSFGFITLMVYCYLSYGGEGYQIMSHTLRFLFPQATLDLKFFQPLSYETLIHDVLLPETAVALIRQDLKLDRDDAIETMRKSQNFGSELHPGDDSIHVKNIINIVHQHRKRYKDWTTIV